MDGWMEFRERIAFREKMENVRFPRTLKNLGTKEFCILKSYVLAFSALFLFLKFAPPPPPLIQYMYLYPVSSAKSS